MIGGPSGYIGFRDTAKKCINFLNAGGKPRVSSTDYMYDVAHGNIPDHRIAYKFGRSENLTTSESDVWIARKKLNYGNTDREKTQFEYWWLCGAAEFVFEKK